MKASPDFYLDFLACEHFGCEFADLYNDHPQAQVAFVKAGILRKSEIEAKYKRCPF